MPADKLPPTVGATATFAAGEQPSGTKLSLIGAQLRAATQSLERAIGDIRGQRVPYVSGAEPEETKHLAIAWGRSGSTGAALAGAEPRPLDIVSLARMIGPSSVLNPRNLELNDMTEPTPNGVFSFALQYPVDVAPTNPDQTGRVVFPTTAAAAAITITDTTLTNYVENQSLLVSNGDWTIDVLSGVVYSYTAASGDGTITYPVDPETFHGGFNYPGARFNVIPDSNQMADGPYLTVSGPTDGRYQVDLPVVDEFQGNAILETVSTQYSQIDGHQIKLPACLDGFTAETEIPSGFVVLKHVDPATGAVTIYDGGTYYYMSQTQVLVGGVTLPNTNGNEYQLVTVGTDIVTSIDDLRIKSRHAHDREFGEPLVEVSSIHGAHSRATIRTGRTFPSGMASNYFPQYLHRDGWTDGQDPLNQDNAMHGGIRFLMKPGFLAHGERGIMFEDSFRGTTVPADGEIVISYNPDALAAEDDELWLGRRNGIGEYDYHYDNMKLIHAAVTHDRSIGWSDYIGAPVGQTSQPPIRIAYISDPITIDLSSGYATVDLNAQLGIPAGHTIVAINAYVKVPFLSSNRWYGAGYDGSGGFQFDWTQSTPTLEISATAVYQHSGCKLKGIIWYTPDSYT